MCRLGTLNVAQLRDSVLGRAHDFSLGEDRRTEGREREWGSWEGAKGSRERCEVNPRPNPLFSALGMASPDNINNVDYHNVIGDNNPVSPLRTPLTVCSGD